MRVEQTSKAYLSTGVTPERRRYVAGSLEAESYLALRNVETILSDAEPESLYSRHGLQSLYSEDTFALADALEAFTRDGGLCDVIVAASHDLDVLQAYSEARS